MAVYDNLFNPRGTGKECALDAYTIACDASHGEIAFIAALSLADYRTLKLLGTFVAAFLNTDKDADRVTRAELGNVFIHWSLNGFQ